MRAFNLEAALNGAALVTRDGRKVSNFKRRTDVDRPYPYPCMAFIEGEENVDVFTLGGLYETHGDSPDDLFLADIQTNEPDVMAKILKWIDEHAEFVFDVVGNEFEAVSVTDLKSEIQQLLTTAKID